MYIRYLHDHETFCFGRHVFQLFLPLNIKVSEIGCLRWLCNAGMFDNSYSQICPSKHFQILDRINLNFKHQVLYSSFASVSAGSSGD